MTPPSSSAAAGTRQPKPSAAVVAEIPVAELPGFVVPVAPGHRGVVRSYDLDGLAVLVFFGRTHIFEGLGPAPVAHPVRVGAAAGSRVAVLTNATGSLRADWQPGTGVLIRDHINWTRSPPSSARTSST